MLDLAADLASLMTGSRHAALFFSFSLFFFFSLNCIFGTAGDNLQESEQRGRARARARGRDASHCQQLKMAQPKPKRRVPKLRHDQANYVLPRCGCASWVTVVRCCCCCCCCSSSIADRDPLTVQITFAASPTPPPTWFGSSISIISPCFTTATPSPLVLAPLALSAYRRHAHWVLAVPSSLVDTLRSHALHLAHHQLMIPIVSPSEATGTVSFARRYA